MLLEHLPLSARRRPQECARQDSNLRSPVYQTGALADHKSAAMPGYATGACRIVADPRCVAAELSSAGGSSAVHGNRPARIRTADPASKARWDWLLPPGAMVAPPRLERGPPGPGPGTLANCATGLFHQCRRRAGHAEGDGVALRPDSKTDGTRTRFSV